jgi:arsenate reductase (glutaredoxin)
MLTVYGIPNCDTVKKTLNWLKDNDQAYEFYNYKKQGITAHKLREWLEVYDWTKLINRAGTTWKKLSDDEKKAIQNPDSAIELMLSNQSIIKRPLIEQDGKAIMLGFDEKQLGQLFS